MSKTKRILGFISIILIFTLMITLATIASIRVGKVIKVHSQEATYTTKWVTAMETRGYSRTVLNEQLEEYLNMLSLEGYTIFKVEVDPEYGYFTIIAYKNNLN